MSEKPNATPQEIEQDPVLARVPRREALKGLGALAVTTTALAAVGCSADAMGASDDGATAGGASGTPATTPATSTSSTAATAGTPAKPAMTPTSSASAMSTKTPASSAAAGSSAATTAGSAAPTMASAAGSPATGGMSPGASAAGSSAGSAGAGGMMAAAPSGAADLSSLACILSPAAEDGPFFMDEKLNRSDLLKGETDDLIVQAVPFALTIGVYHVNGMMCQPAAGLQCDIWHCNSNGVYSDVTPGFVQQTDTRGKQYLRGYQITNESGVVNFSTIYPGWYPSRTIHIHLKIRMPMGGSNFDFTTQLYFDENISKEVLSMGPYAKTPGTRMVFNTDDHIFNGTQMNGQKPSGTPPGMETTLTIAKAGMGYTGAIKIGLKT